MKHKVEGNSDEEATKEKKHFRLMTTSTVGCSRCWLVYKNKATRFYDAQRMKHRVNT